MSDEPEDTADTACAVESMTVDDLRRDETWWRIYEASFPANERESPEVVLKSVQRGTGMAFRFHCRGTTFGLATTHVLKEPAAVFLVYLAVAPAERKRGAGAALFQYAWQSGSDRLIGLNLQPAGMVWEVDPVPSIGGEVDAAEAEVRRRRIAFFQRCGGQLLPQRYLQPPVDGIAAVPMMLMFLPAEGERSPTPETVADLVKAIYFEKYGAINGIDKSILEELINKGPSVNGTVVHLKACCKMSYAFRSLARRIDRGSCINL